MTYTMSDTDSAYQGHLNDSSVTLAEVLQATGYRTLMSASGRCRANGAWPSGIRGPTTGRQLFARERSGVEQGRGGRE